MSNVRLIKFVIGFVVPVAVLPTPRDTRMSGSVDLGDSSSSALSRYAKLRSMGTSGDRGGAAHLDNESTAKVSEKSWVLTMI